MAKRGQRTGRSSKRMTPKTGGQTLKTLLGKLTAVDRKLTDITKAWTGVVHGLEVRARERFEMAASKLKGLRGALKDSAIVDLDSVGKVLKRLNDKAMARIPKEALLDIRGMLDVDRVFRATSDAIDDVLDEEASTGLKELQTRLERLFKLRMRSMKDIDRRFKKRLTAVRTAIQQLRSLVPTASKKVLKRISKAIERIDANLAGFSIEDTRTRKKDLLLIERMVRALDKDLKGLMDKVPPSKAKGKKKAKAKGKRKG